LILDFLRVSPISLVSPWLFCLPLKPGHGPQGHRERLRIFIRTINFLIHLQPVKRTGPIIKFHKMKITVVGAGAVGATCADNIARKELATELVILDIKEGLAEGKAQDMMQTAALLGFDTRITGSTNGYSKS